MPDADTPGTDADAAARLAVDMLPPPDLAHDAAPAKVDHSQLCQQMCTEKAPGACGPRSVTACQDACLADLDGFGMPCGECLTNNLRLGDEATGCWPRLHFDHCAAACAGNRQLATKVDALAKCDAFCRITGDPPSDCAASVEPDCRADCMARLEGIPNSCAACFAGASTAPQVAYPACAPQQWVAFHACSAWCS